MEGDTKCPAEKNRDQLESQLLKGRPWVATEEPSIVHRREHRCSTKLLREASDRMLEDAILHVQLWQTVKQTGEGTGQAVRFSLFRGNRCACVPHFWCHGQSVCAVCAKCVCVTSS